MHLLEKIWRKNILENIYYYNNNNNVERLLEKYVQYCVQDVVRLTKISVKINCF